jgi:hypothetical protein
MRLEQSFITSYEYYINSSFTTDPSKFQESVKDVRDKLRAKFETNTSSAAESKKVYVSSIAKWNGIQSDYNGYAFVVKIGDHQWLFMFFGAPSTNKSFSFFFQSSSIGTYFKGYSSTIGETPEPSSSTNNMSCTIHYNSGSGFYNMGFTDTTTMRKTSGATETDFFTPAQSPYTAATSFMPDQGSGKLKGLSFSDTNINRLSIVVDNEKPFLMVYFGSSSAIVAAPNYSWIFGSILVPTTSGDTNKLASFGLNNQPSSPNSPGLTVYHPTTGVPTGYDISYSNGYDLINMWTNDGGTYKLNFKSVQVIKGGLPNKGFIDTDVVRVAGPNNNGASTFGNLIMNTPTGPLTCLCGDLFTPWGSVSLSERYGYFVDYPIL